MTDDVSTHLSFSIRRDAIEAGILIPKLYDPELKYAESIARRSFNLPRLGDLLEPGNQGSRLGSWIRREHYGTGRIAFVRTSDFNNWRLRPDFKIGVARYVYDEVSERQDVHANDILMVAHGTYLVGAVAIVTDGDLPLVLQDHVFRLRVRESIGVYGEGIDSFLLLAALSTRFVRRQVRARQFSADIIDKIGNRHLDLRVAIPKDLKVRQALSDAVQVVIKSQSDARRNIVTLLTSDLRMTRERAETSIGFSLPRRDIRNKVLIPKYYDPFLKAELRREAELTKAPWTSIGHLISEGLLEIGTGVEVGKMAYGTGTISFVRTSDIAELEVKADPRQGISQDIFDKFSRKGSISEYDVLVVRDGTYLVGSSAIVMQGDTPALICGGLYRLRCKDVDTVDPFSILGLVNLPIVRAQMRSMQFTRDVIDTLGNRFREVQIPDPRSRFAKELGSKLGVEMKAKHDLQRRIAETISSIEPPVPIQSTGRPGWSMRG